MKKLLLTILVVIILPFTGCIDNSIHHWAFAYDVDDVKEIKLIDANGDFTYSIIKELDISLAEEVYSDIISLEMMRYGTNLSHPYGICFLIVFDSGEYDIIARQESKHYRYSGDEILSYNSWLRCNEDEFNALVGKYLPSGQGA